MRKTCSTCRFCKCGVPMDEEPCNSCHVVTVNEFTNWQSEILTNAGRIRAMTDEELADFIIGVCHAVNNQYYGVRRELERGRIEFIEWLKSPAEGEQ